MINIKTIWAILGVYGIWFAIFSGSEEVLSGKYWKVLASLALATIIALYIQKQPK
jgi:hypothetical protein